MQNKRLSAILYLLVFEAGIIGFSAFTSWFGLILSVIPLMLFITTGYYTRHGWSYT